MATDIRTIIPGAAPAPLLPDQPVPRELQQRLLREGIPPPSALWVDANDILTLKCRNTLAAVSVQVSARLMEPDGRIITPAFTLAPTTDRTINTATQALYEGYLLSAAVQAIGATLPNRGQTYCVLRVDRMPAPSNLIHYVLGADYLSGSLALEWPYGRVVAPTEGPGLVLRRAGTTPAAGADFTVQINANTRARVRGVTAQLVTSAAVATRRANLIVDDGATTLYNLNTSVTQAAGVTLPYFWVPGWPTVPAVVDQLDLFLPPDLIIGANWRIRSQTDNLQAGDQWSAINLLSEEWLED